MKSFEKNESSTTSHLQILHHQSSVKEETWVTDAIMLMRSLNQGQINRLRGPGQLTFMSNFPPIIG